MTYTDERELLEGLPRPFIRCPGFRRDDGLDLLWVLPK